MVRPRCTFPSFTCRRSYIAVSDAGPNRKSPGREIAGAFLRFFEAAERRGREINNPDAVNLNSLWN